MISRLRGTLVSRELDHIEVETAGGVVYEIQIPLSILERLPKPPAPDFEIRTLQVVREDSVTLYGFMEPFERELFSRLLGASGVGPKVALAMLSITAPDTLAQAIATADKPAITQAPGVGPKLANRIISELKDKMGGVALGSGIFAVEASKAAGGSEDPGVNPAMADAVSALVNLGYR